MKLLIVVVNTYFGDKSKTAVNRFRFASIRLISFNDMLKVVKQHVNFPQNLFHSLCFDFGH